MVTNKTFNFSERILGERARVHVCTCTTTCAQSCLTLCDLLNCSLSGSVCGIFQARILEWIAISSLRGSSQPRDQTCVSCIGTWSL